MCETLGCFEIPDTAVDVLSLVEERLKQLIAKLPQGYASPLVSLQSLSPQQIAQLEEFCEGTFFTSN